MLASMRGSQLLLLVSVLVLVGCPSGEQRFDTDGDGWEDAGDCDPDDPSIHPEADDPYPDGIDQDCDNCAASTSGDGVDTDCDGFPANVPTYDPEYDCDDANPAAYPGADEIQGDGIDQDCDGEDCIDGDLDGSCEGPADCDDADPTSYLGADESPDGADNDCDGAVDEGTTAYDDDNDGSCEGFDLNGDGGAQCSDGSEPGDCDDANAALNLIDQDGDEHDTCGGDCDDFNQDVFPGAPELCNGQDDDCDGALSPGELDVDLDGFASCEGDCDDTNPAIHPGDTDGDGYTLCDPVPDCDDGDALLTPEDTDLDGHSTCEGDCDDSDPLIYLGAEERCNGLDDDCDGSVPGNETDGDLDLWLACEDCDDGDVSLYGMDEDSDGISMCAGDCDDGNSAIHPGAFDGWGNGQDEDCSGEDGVDWDGDGAVANAVPANSSTPEWDCDDLDPGANRLDVDGDGVDTCAPAPDCDDTDSSRYPGNLEDSCDGFDSDCAADALEVDDDGDGWLECEGDCDDSDTSLNLDDFDLDGANTCEGDCDDTDSTVYPGLWEDPSDGIDSDCDGNDVAGLGQGAHVFAGAYYQHRVGLDVASGDLDDDGYDDVAVVSHGMTADLGTVAVRFQGLGSDGGGVSVADFDLTIEGGAIHGSLFRVAIGDLDGDGVEDLVVGAPSADLDGSNSGGVFVFFGATLPTGTVELATADAVLPGSDGEQAGSAIAIGDVNGDGVDDLAVGAPYADGEASQSGRVFVLYGSPSGFASASLLTAADAIVNGSVTSERAGTAVAVTGDLDGDGTSDLVIGANNYSPPPWIAGQGWGRVLVTGEAKQPGEHSASSAFVTIDGDAAQDRLGAQVVSAGDVDGDGLAELLVTVPNDDVVLVYAGATMSLGGLLVAADASLTLVCDAEGDGAEAMVRGGGNLDGDGLADFVVGLPSANGNGAEGGEVHVFLGAGLATGTTGLSSASITAFWSEAAGDHAGLSVSLGDLDGDGRDDLVVGAPSSDGAAVLSGTVYGLLNSL
jgi:hypothetical protein